MNHLDKHTSSKRNLSFLAPVVKYTSSYFALPSLDRALSLPYPNIAQGLLCHIHECPSPTNAQSSLSPPLNLPSPIIAEGALCSVGELLSPTNALIPLSPLCDSPTPNMAQPSWFKLLSLPNLSLLSLHWVLSMSAT